MPVAKEDFDGMGDVEGRRSSVTPKILEFLGRDPDMAYTGKEISETTDLNPQTVSQRLRILAQQGKVVRKQADDGTVYNALA